MEFPMRLNKYLAHQGIASRREADELIARGGVLVNGVRATLGTKVEEGDEVALTKKTAPKQYLAYYKGRGTVTHSPENGELDIAARILRDYGLSDVHPIGRLDKDSEGLILLSNDGRLTGPLLDPARGNEKEYEVTVDKAVNGWFLKHMASGVKIERYTTKPAAVELVDQKRKLTFRITLTEGKKHQIRRMCAALGYQVERLKRVRVMNVELGNLKPNQYRKLTDAEVKTLLKTLGIKG